MDNIGNRSSMLKIIIHDHINVDIVIFLVYPRLLESSYAPRNILIKSLNHFVIVVFPNVVWYIEVLCPVEEANKQIT